MSEAKRRRSSSQRRTLSPVMKPSYENELEKKKRKREKEKDQGLDARQEN
jgi:hypothetical protein